MTTIPIKNLNDLEKMEKFLLSKNVRDYTLFILGCNTALRISDLLSLRWKDVYLAETCEYSSHICITEQKTGKTNCIFLNNACLKALKMLKETTQYKMTDEYIFKSKYDKSKPISRQQAYRIIKNAAEINHIEGNISCHSLRKTFGYHAWKNGAPTALIMNIYNHSNIEITKRYLSIDQDDKDSLFQLINL